MPATLDFYRNVVRLIRKFPEPSIGKKLQYNAKELIRLRKDVTDPNRIEKNLQEGYELLKVYQLLLSAPELLTAVTRKKP